MSIPNERIRWRHAGQQPLPIQLHRRARRFATGLLRAGLTKAEAGALLLCALNETQATTRETARIHPVIGCSDAADDDHVRRDCFDCQLDQLWFGQLPDAAQIRAAEKACEAELQRAYEMRRGPRRKPFSKELRAKILERDGSRCSACDATTDLAIDHIIPVRAGGTNDPANLQVLCRRCNSAKRDRNYAAL